MKAWNSTSNSTAVNSPNRLNSFAEKIYQTWVTDSIDNPYSYSYPYSNTTNGGWHYPTDSNATNFNSNEVTNTNSKVTNTNSRKENDNMFNFGNMFNGMFKPVANDCCKMSMNGKIAVKTSTGYKTFDMKKKKLTNCANFAFNMDNMFWVVPTFKVELGDIILVNEKPRCVIEINDTTIKTFNYEDSTIEEIVPEHHVFMGKTYCYGKIFTPFANMSKGNGMNGFMKMAMMMNMFNGNNSNTQGFNPMMFMMMNNNNLFEDMFEGAFDFGSAAEEEEE